jgi:hypothetical protein
MEGREMTRDIHTILRDVIDSRDLIEWLEKEYDETDAETEDTELADEITRLSEEGIEYWEHGAMLIRDSYFTEYAQQLAEDCGMIPDGLSWPLTCIDWDLAARELQDDYFTVEFMGVTYWTR